MHCRWGLVIATVVCWAAPAHAFQIESTITGACHESITFAALEAEGWGSILPPPLGELPALSEDQRRAADDVPFRLVAGARNPWALALLIGVRSNDIRDNAPSEIASLVHIHNDPGDQASHCIRRQEDDGPAGDAAALAACRAFIEGELQAGGWFTSDAVATNIDEDVALALSFRGRVALRLPRFSYRLGRALHALEDGYTHVFRNPATDAVQHVHNWIDMATEDGYDIARDGYPHVGVFDDCRRDHPGEVGRVKRATTAAVRLLHALVNSSTVAERRTAVAAALDATFVIEPGCTAANDYCNSPELGEAGGCDASAGRSAATLLAVVLALGVTRIRRRWRGATVAALTTGVLVSSVGLVTTAHAQRAPFVEGRLGAALDKGGLAAAVGGGIDRGKWSVGGMVEWNPWFSIDNPAVVAGTVNAYGTLMRRWYRSDKFSLHSRLELGASVILFRLVGVERGNIGFYFGGSILGIKIPLSRCLDLVLDPSHFAVPAPQVTGFPFYYRQYRISAGLQWHW